MIGVIGAGKFGLTICRLLSYNSEVLLYVRNPDSYSELLNTRASKGIALPQNVQVTDDKSRVPKECNIIFPVVPSANFADMIRGISSYLAPRHIIIHGTKGLDLHNANFEELTIDNISASNIRTLSQVVLEESPVVRVGCLSGPNLASEILKGLPTATVVASEYDEVIQVGQKYLSSNVFYPFGSNDIKGAEIAGAYKNIIAIASGILGGRKLGKNLQGMLITRGLREMSLMGKLLGSTNEAVMGTAGIGDLVATATSEASRNYSFGYKIGLGGKMSTILEDMEEVAEGVRTLKIANFLSQKYKIQAHITQTLYKVVYEEEDVNKGIARLMRFPTAKDVDFL